MIHMVSRSICVWGSAFLLASPASAQVILKDEKSFFEAVVPADWKVDRPTDARESKFLRYEAMAPDKQRALYFYVLEADADIVLDKLESIDMAKLGWNLGQLASERKVNETAMERRYGRGPKGLYAAARFQVDGPRGYLVLAISVSPNLSFADEVFRAFTVRPPFVARLKQWLVIRWNPWETLVAIIAIVASIVLYRVIRKVTRPRPSLIDGREQFARIMGITHLPQERQAVLVDRFISIAVKRVGARIDAALSPQERKQFASLTAGGRKNDDEASAFLLKRGVDNNQVLIEETKKLLNDVRVHAVKLNGLEEFRNALGEVKLQAVVQLALEVADGMS